MIGDLDTEAFHKNSGTGINLGECIQTFLASCLKMNKVQFIV